ncbi:hypothetical protein E2C01_088748 [Portunus trituberculatus]|uniref:Uncharacterized protein n=1 Tax=Portunus trituberculatus TaxID=210409 RepID=A0A5B7JGB2_PORTR|nr:hypothetical protein [Portunus trituberculatus]
MSCSDFTPDNVLKRSGGGDWEQSAVVVLVLLRCVLCSVVCGGVLGASCRPPNHHCTTGSGDDPSTRHLKVVCWPALTHAPGASSVTLRGGTAGKAQGLLPRGNIISI